MFWLCIVHVLSESKTRPTGRALLRSLPYSMMLATTPAPTVRPPSRMAKRSFSSIAIGVISSIVHRHVVARHHHLGALRQRHHARHVRRAEVELRTVVGEERRVPAALLLRQDVGLGLELLVRLDRARLAQHLAALHRLLVDAAQQAADVVAGLALVQKLAEHLDARHHRLLRVADADDLDFLANLDLPRSMRPVTTVPRPEIENTSSIGIRNGWSFGRSGSGM